MEEVETPDNMMSFEPPAEMVAPLVYHEWCLSNPPTPLSLAEALGMDGRRWNSAEKEMMDHLVKQITRMLKNGMKDTNRWELGVGPTKRKVLCFGWYWDDLLSRRVYKREICSNTATITEVRLGSWQRVAEIFGRSAIAETFQSGRMQVAICPTGYAVRNWKAGCQDQRELRHSIYDPVDVEQEDLFGILGYQVDLKCRDSCTKTMACCISPIANGW